MAKLSLTAIAARRALILPVADQMAQVGGLVSKDEEEVALLPIVLSAGE